MHRIRLSMQDDLTGGKVGAEVEIDEAFIGGKARFMHKSDSWRKNLKGGGVLAMQSCSVFWNARPKTNQNTSEL